MERIKRLPVDHRNRAEEARKRLGITKEQMNGQRRIAPMLREIGFNAERIVEVLECDGSPDSIAFIDKYHSVSKSDRAYLSVEEIAVAAGIPPRRLFELIAGARLEQSQDAVKLIIADSMPKVVQNAVKAATESTPIMDGQGNVQGYTYGDIKATEFLGKVSGLMPTPKGSTTVFNVGNQLPIPESEPDELPLQDMDSTLKMIQQATSQPALPEPKVIHDAEYEEI